MTRTLALSICAVAFAHPALAGGQVDPATVTCSEYNRNSHQGMVDINAAVYQSTREDPKLKALTENQLGDMVDKVCADHRDARVIEALP
jgi:hypothetical protein